MPASNAYDANSLYQPGRGRSFDDSEPYMLSKQTGRARAPENENILKEKSNPVAKIKVVVCSFAYLNSPVMFHFYLKCFCTVCLIVIWTFFCFGTIPALYTLNIIQNFIELSGNEY